MVMGWDDALIYAAIAAATTAASKGAESFFSGTPEKRENVSNLRRSQEPLYRQLQRTARGEKNEGAFGDAAKYWQDILANDPEAMAAFEAPEMRKFNEQIIPGLAEQFAGMGAGNLSSSGFRNAAVGAGTDLSERLGAIRANLRNQAATGLFNLGQAGLQSFSSPTTTQQGSEGFASAVAPGVGNAVTQYALSQSMKPEGASVQGGAISPPSPNAIQPKSMGSNWMSSSMKGKSSPYGGPLRSPVMTQGMV